MKTLILVRHAKSDWGYEFLKDIDRPLNERGYRDAYTQSKWYAEKYNVPDILVSSPAVRAISTALIFARQLKYDEQKILIRHGIYESNVENFLSMIRNLPDDFQSAMVFGHNPTITNVANEIANDFYVDNIPTCGIIVLSFNTDDWKKVGEIKADKVEYKFVK